MCPCCYGWLVHSRTHPRPLAHAGALAFWLGRAIGRRPNHCFTRWNRTNKTAFGSGLGQFACMVRGPAQIGHTPTCVQAGPLVALTHGQRGDGRPRREANRAIEPKLNTARCALTAHRQPSSPSPLDYDAFHALGAALRSNFCAAAATRRVGSTFGYT